MNLVEVLQGAHVALAVIQARLILLITLVMTFLLFGAAMWLQTQLAAIIASLWGLFVFLPVLLAGRGSRNGPVQEAQHHDEASPQGG